MNPVTVAKALMFLTCLFCLASSISFIVSMATKDEQTKDTSAKVGLGISTVGMFVMFYTIVKIDESKMMED